MADNQSRKEEEKRDALNKKQTDLLFQEASSSIIPYRVIPCPMARVQHSHSSWLSRWIQWALEKIE
jgi:hypothetical protein